ncbi:hypothetical protein PBI_TEAMOCIL_72 [Microbacterium phage Teamocil]|uniref:Uncharacterized protein n=1 Tax=Microbacterium phage Teamocil TaxID=2656554 RepID=A0A649VWL5_9CAUD|nr:hypothetical protein QDA12_gp72 [Microbacterium phage Teamocil]QGJ88923.1 hypothetical protein PBI_GINA_72 [Microbacterium phage Gina]QGJ97020.1 hypothetical protein PBI_TEAMOCIL_72 [Microbacterium phage Teamocil]
MPEPVPTVADLVRMGAEYAEVAEWTMGSKNGKTPPKPSKYLIHPKGHALLGDIMRRNAAEAVANGEGDWHPEPPHRRPKGTP